MRFTRHYFHCARNPCILSRKSKRNIHDNAGRGAIPRVLLARRRVFPRIDAKIRVSRKRRLIAAEIEQTQAIVGEKSVDSAENRPRIEFLTLVKRIFHNANRYLVGVDASKGGIAVVGSEIRRVVKRREFLWNGVLFQVFVRVRRRVCGIDCRTAAVGAAVAASIRAPIGTIAVFDKAVIALDGARRSIGNIARLATTSSCSYRPLGTICDIVCRGAASVVEGSLRKRIIAHFALFDGGIFFFFIFTVAIRLRVDLRILRLITDFRIFCAMIIGKGKLRGVERDIRLGKRDRPRTHDARERHRYRRHRNALLRCTMRHEFRCLLHMLRHNDHL